MAATKAAGMTGLDEYRAPSLSPLDRRGFGWLCLGYAVVMLYASTIIGPMGIHFVF